MKEGSPPDEDLILESSAMPYTVFVDDNFHYADDDEGIYWMKPLPRARKYLDANQKPG